MRQKFDVGDIVRVDCAVTGSEDKGIIVEMLPINPNYGSNSRTYHTDEYKCKVDLFGCREQRWVRAKWLSHISKI